MTSGPFKCWRAGCINLVEEQPAFCAECLPPERPQLALTTENIDKALKEDWADAIRYSYGIDWGTPILKKGVRAYVGDTLVYDSGACTCKTLLNGHWDGCLLKRD